MTAEHWLEAHAYLQPVADLFAQVDRAAAEIAVLDAPVPDWEDYRRDFLAGVTLLTSADAAIDLEPGGRMAAALLESLLHRLEPLPPRRERSRTNCDREPQVARRIAGFLLGDDTLASSSPGLLRYVGWTAMTRFLRPVVNAFDSWRDEERWLRRYCPTCGSLPAMAQLAGVDPARRRLLSCGCCATRWQFKRTGCPFCETDSQRLTSVTIDAEPGVAHRPLRVLSRLPQDLRRGRPRDADAIRLVFTPSRPHCARSRIEKAGGVLYEFEPAPQPESVS